MYYSVSQLRSETLEIHSLEDGVDLAQHRSGETNHHTCYIAPCVVECLRQNDKILQNHVQGNSSVDVVKTEQCE